MQIYTDELNESKVVELINSKYESDSLDFKEAFDISNENKSYLELLKDIAAFNNTEGGYIIFGVTDSYNQVGLSEDVEIDSTKIDFFLEKYVDIKINYVVSTHNYKDKKFQIVYVEKSNVQRPAVFMIDGQYGVGGGKSKEVFKRGQAYVRKGTKSEPNLSHWFSLHGIKEEETEIPNYSLKHNLPKPNYGGKFVGRENDLKTILDGILEEEHTYRILVHGIGGLGKTALVQRVAYILTQQANQRNLSLDYIFWVSAKNEEYTVKKIRRINQELNSFRDLIDNLVDVLEVELNDEKSIEEKIEILKDVFKEKQGIIIIDNWETIKDENQEIVNFLLRVPGKNKIIITSRHKIIDQQFKNIAPTPMVDEEGLSFLNRWRENFGDDILTSLSDLTLKNIASAAGGIPIAMIMALGQISLGKPVSDVIRELKEYEIDDPLLDFCFSETYKLLSTSEKRILLSLTFFQESVTKKIINAMTQINAREISDCLQRLIEFSFIDSNIIDNNGEITQKYEINPITKSFLKKQLISVPTEKELLEENYQMISIELKNASVLEISSMKSVIEKLEYVTMEDKLAASFAASATRVWKTNQNWEEALKKFEKAKILSPNLGYIYGQWAWVCEKANKVVLARENYHKAVQLDEENIKLWYQWAMFELLNGDFRQAEEKFNMVLRKNPDDPRSWHGLGRVLLKKHKAGDKISLDNIEMLFQRGFINKPRKVASELKHNSINSHYLAMIKDLKGNEHNPQENNLQELSKKLNSNENQIKNENSTKQGYVEKVIKSGAFVKSAEGEKYYLHISKVSNSFVENINDLLKVDQEVNFKVIKKNVDKLHEIMLV